MYPSKSISCGDELERRERKASMSAEIDRVGAQADSYRAHAREMARKLESCKAPDREEFDQLKEEQSKELEEHPRIPPGREVGHSQVESRIAQRVRQLQTRPRRGRGTGRERTQNTPIFGASDGQSGLGVGLDVLL